MFRTSDQKTELTLLIVSIHLGERPYGCRFCWKAFADGGTLRKHERIHTGQLSRLWLPAAQTPVNNPNLFVQPKSGEKPYACPVCPRAFNQRVVLREHIRSHHSAPHPNYELSHMQYYCSVCGNLFKSPADIIQHLIEHSDANTVSNRQPVVSGSPFFLSHFGAIFAPNKAN